MPPAVGSLPAPPPPIPVHAAPPPPVALATARRGSGTWPWVGLATTIAVLLVGGVVAVAAIEDDRDPPGEWDPRVTRLVRFVEARRDLDFKHAVPIEFLSEEDFIEEVSTDEAQLTDEDRETFEVFGSVFRAVGLLESSVDPFDEVEELGAVGTLAFYDPYDDRIVIRGTEMTVGLEVTVVHELTHALQQQYYDLTQFDGEDSTSGQYNAFDALVEGDAQRIEFEYIDSLTDEDLASYEAEYEADFEEADIGDDSPAILQAFFGEPYEFGDTLTAVLDAEGGNDAVDDAFEDPPSTEEHLIDPYAYLEGDEALDVPRPQLADGEEELDSGDFGAITWFLFLAERIDPRQALEAVDGWGGDAYVLFEADDQTCVRLAFRGDTGADGDQMESAATAWTRELPEGMASVQRRGPQVIVESCDPGEGSDIEVPGRSADVIALPLTRTIVTLGAVEVGAPRESAQCMADNFLDLLDEDQVLSLYEFLYAEEADPEMEDLAVRAAESCGA